MSIKAFCAPRIGLLAASWISMVVCMGTAINKKMDTVAAPLSMKIVTPKELGEEVLLSQDDLEELGSPDDPVSKCTLGVCESVEAEVGFRKHIKATARLDIQSPVVDVGQLQEQSFITLASERFMYCQDILLFGLALGSLYFWRYFRASVKDLKQCESSQGGTFTAPIRNADSALNVNSLVKAMYSENKDDLRKLLDERSVNACDEVCCCTALHVAAQYKCMEAAKALLERGADADVKDIWDETPLHFAARMGHTEICALLLKKGAQINAANEQGWTPLIVAAKAGMEDTCEFLLDHAAHAGGIDEEDLPPLLNRLLQCRILSGL